MRWSASLALALSWVAVGLLGCASAFPGFAPDAGGRLRHLDRGYSVQPPEAGTWRVVSIEGADLGFRSMEGAALSVGTSCRKTRAGAHDLARHLLIGAEGARLVDSGEVELDGRSGYAQTFDVPDGALSHRIRTVTVKIGDCTFDWVLAAPSVEVFWRVAADFELWWRSLRYTPQDSDQGAPDTGVDDDPMRVAGDGDA